MDYNNTSTVLPTRKVTRWISKLSDTLIQLLLVILIRSRNIASIKLPLFCDDLVDVEVINPDCLNNSLYAQVERYNSVLSQALEQHAPMKERCVKRLPNYPWFNENILTEKKIRRQLENKWKKSHLEIDRQMYCHQKQIVNQQIKRAKWQYHKELFSEVANYQRTIFRLNDRLLHRRKSSPLPKCESRRIWLRASTCSLLIKQNASETSLKD